MNLAFAAAAELHQRGNVCALQLRAKDDDQVFLRFQFVAQLLQSIVRSAGAGERPGSGIVAIEERNQLAFTACRHLDKARGLTLQLDGLRIHDKKFCLIQADIGADIPCQQRMALCGIIADQQDGRSAGDVTHGGRGVFFSGDGAGKAGKIGCAVVINVVGAQHRSRELLQKIIFFVGGAVGADHANRLSAFAVANLAQALADMLNGFFPCSGRELAVFADQRLAQTAWVIEVIKSVAALDAEEIAVNAALVAIIATDDVHAGIRAAHAQRGLAAIAAMRADGANVLHLPRARFVAISAGGQRADRADVDAHAALFAVKMVAFIRRDHRAGAAKLHAESGNVHAFTADAHAAVAEDAARTIKVDHGRPLLFFFMQLAFHIARFRRAILERHVLQFAFAAGIAYGAIQRMVAEQEFDHRLACLANFVRVGGHDHAVGDRAPCRRSGAWASSQCAPGTCGTRPEGKVPGNSRMMGLQFPRPCRLQ